MEHSKIVTYSDIQPILKYHVYAIQNHLLPDNNLVSILHKRIMPIKRELYDNDSRRR